MPRANLGDTMLQVILNFVFRCGHRNVTRPITLLGQHTYVACLDCGRQLHYDLETMQVGAVIGASPSVPMSVKNDSALGRYAPAGRKKILGQLR